jgi:hypothetical protein
MRKQVLVLLQIAALLAASGAPANAEERVIKHMLHEVRNGAVDLVVRIGWNKWDSPPAGAMSKDTLRKRGSSAESVGENSRKRYGC